MFGHRYFGARFYGPRYFGPAETAAGGAGDADDGEPGKRYLRVPLIQEQPAAEEDWFLEAAAAIQLLDEL